MLNRSFHIFILLILISVITISAQQIIEESNTITVDNLDDNNLFTSGMPGTNLSGPHYKEYPSNESQPAINDGWWSQVTSQDYGGSNRWASRQGTGDPTGSHVSYSFDVAVTDYYLVYHHLRNSANSSARVLVKFFRFGESVPIDSIYYHQFSHNLSDGYGSWVPLGIVEVFAADSALTVDLGTDVPNVNILQVDAVRILRSSQSGPDIEFGNRRSDLLMIDPGTQDTIYSSSFFKERAPIDFPQTTFKWAGFSEKNIPVYNLGSEPLIISGFASQTTRFSITTPTPIVIPPGGKSEITIKFAPLGEEVTIDTLAILSNDALEPEALLPVIGEGINYNFVLNASDGTEPHWNAPPNSSYEELGAFLNSSAGKSTWTYPIPGGNLNGRVTLENNPVAAFYKFTLPDTIYGAFYLEYSGPVYSSNAARNVTIDVVTPFFTNTEPALGDTQRVTGFDSRLSVSVAKPWARLGGNKVFTLNGGGLTTIRFTHPSQGNADYLRADLLRVRAVPIAPDISTNLDPYRVINFGAVSIFDSVRLAEYNYQRNFVLSSNGETPLIIDTMYLSDGNAYKIDNLPRFPASLPAIDGQYNLFVSFLPNLIESFTDTLSIHSNDEQDPVIKIVLIGRGVGTGITVDNTEETNFIFPADIIPAGTPKDNSNMHKWFEYVNAGAVNGTGLYTHIYFTPETDVQKFEWFPYFPFNPNNPGINEADSFDVYAQVPVLSPNSSPAVKYRVKHFNGITDVVISQLNRTLNNGKIPLGRFTFIRGGKDSPGSGTIYGSVELINDTALVSAYYANESINPALQDTFVLRADAIIFEEASDVVTVVEEVNLLPTEYYLSQNYPNPFNPSTQIRFALPQSSAVELKIYDVLGREVSTLLNGEYNAGTYTVEWNGRNNYGAQVASGMYIYRIKAGNFVQTKKMMMLK